MPARWLYNSDGDPIAYVSGAYIYSPRGDFVGRLYEDKTVWNCEYVGELYADDRLVYDARKLKGARGVTGTPGLPGFIGEPPSKGPAALPQGYRDVDLR